MEFHGATLTTVSLDWATGTLTLDLTTASGSRTIEARGVSTLVLPRLQPLGPSVSVDSVAVTESQLTLKMQSGDSLVVVAEGFDIP